MLLTQLFDQKLNVFSLIFCMRSQSVLFVSKYISLHVSLFQSFREREGTTFWGKGGEKKYSEIEVLLIIWILHATIHKPHLVFRTSKVQA